MWQLPDEYSPYGLISPDNCQIILSDADASAVEWIDDGRISFIMRKDRPRPACPSAIATCSLDIAAGEVSMLLDRDGVSPYLAKVCGDKLYFAGYTYLGEEIFAMNLSDDIYSRTIVTKSEFTRQNGFFDSRSDRSSFNQYGVRNYDPDKAAEYKVTMFHFGRYLLPTVWAIIPATLDSSAYFTDSFSLPFLAPQLMLVNESPTGRLSYTMKVTYDYIKQYPNNDLDVTLRLPCTTIGLSWSNWMGGTAVWYKDAFVKSTKAQGVPNQFPICFSDAASVQSSFVLGGYDVLSVSASMTHQYSQWAFYKDEATGTNIAKFHKNQFYWMESLMYQFIIPTNGANRWNRGFYINMMMYQAPKIADNSELYIADFDIQFRMPVSHSIFQFTALQSGFELCDWHKAKNVYRVDSSLYKLLGNRIDAVGNTSLNIVDGKAFGSTFNNNQTASGFGYISLNAGFDFTVWDKPHYWHFATLGFKEFFIRVYNQYIYLLAMQPAIDNLFVDVVSEFVLELTAGYGNLSAQFAFGAALGYQGGSNIPSWGVNFNIAFGIGN